ncbi:hypothetical protein ACFONN_05940 [Dyella humi]|uniref:Uncharacterized protein n=1 Tax=Dyella humi TaxID=1770547 RepID=A0ABW8IK36_9GAMM
MLKRVTTLSTLLLLIQPIAYAAETSSQYSSLASDTVISSAGKTVLQQTINISTPGWVFVETDGRVYPSGGYAIADLWINVDGVMKSNASVIDWSKSSDAQQHSYNAIGAVYVSAGQHTISLVAQSLNSPTFTIGAGSNLSTVVNPAPTVGVAALGADTGTLSFNTAGLTGTSVLPTSPEVTLNVNGANGSSVVALASARNYEYGNAGDPLVTVTLDGSTLPNNQASWSDNDMYSEAENQAPFFSHAYIPNVSSAMHAVSLAASALPYSGGLTNTVQYRMGADSTLIALQGMQLSGGASFVSDAHNVTNYICVGTNQGWSGCPPVGTAVPIAEGNIVIPPGHNGIVFITGKTRIQAGSSDAGGTAALYLTVDGVQVGSTGIQQLKSPDSVSTRTLSASYLATGVNTLSVGTHHVVLYGSVTGSFIHAAMTQDLPLVWFD